MTEKWLTFPSPNPSPTSPEPGDGVLRSKFNFFPVQHQYNPTPPKIFVPGHHARIQEFFVRVSGGGGGGGGVGVQAPQLILQFKEGVQWFYYTFSWGGGGAGGPTFSRVGGPIETHITITCDFPGGGVVWTPYPPLWIRIWTLWHFGTNRLRRACAASF